MLFDQQQNAVVVTYSRSTKSREIVVAVQFIATAQSGEIRSGGVFEIKLSDSLKFKITNCTEGDLAHPKITHQNESLKFRIVKRYPWIMVRCNGVTVMKHNFFSFKNQECRSVWAIKANMVHIITSLVPGGSEKPPLEIEISKQGEIAFYHL